MNLPFIQFHRYYSDQCAEDGVPPMVRTIYDVNITA